MRSFAESLADRIRNTATPHTIRHDRPHSWTRNRAHDSRSRASIARTGFHAAPHDHTTRTAAVPPVHRRAVPASEPVTTTTRSDRSGRNRDHDRHRDRVATLRRRPRRNGRDRARVGHRQRVTSTRRNVRARRRRTGTGAIRPDRLVRLRTGFGGRVALPGAARHRTRPDVDGSARRAATGLASTARPVPARHLRRAHRSTRGVVPSRGELMDTFAIAVLSALGFARGWQWVLSLIRGSVGG